ncbi:MAG: T9SS type A sorting domain-containing protein [Bacteroidota bacterium]
MKIITFRFLAAFLILVPAYLSATDWNTPDKGWFTGQTGIDNIDPTYNTAMATVSFEGQVFYFSNYQNGLKGQISLRKMTNTGAAGTINWTMVKTTGMTNLNDLGQFNWQPAPVVFNNVLYLFVGNKSNGISYSAYNAGADTWDTLVALPGDFSNNGGRKLGFGMAAVVVNGRLCLVAQNYWSFIEIFTTTDLVNWSYFHDAGHSGIITSTGAANSTYGVVSAISQTYKDIGTGKSKLKYAYIDGNKHPRTVECSFDTAGNYLQISDAVISTERAYQSVALIEGTVTGDPGSAGHCVQAFLKLDTKDNGFCSYRIQRWQSEEGGSWTKQENNLVKQNYLWARQLTNLCAVNFAISDTISGNIRQYICLIYTAYNDRVWPLACAWAETDRLIWDPFHAKSLQLAGAENTQYVGYIEGPPPFHVNDSTLTNPYYSNPGMLPISEIGYESTNTQSSQVEMSYDVGGEVNFKAGCFKAGLSAAFKQLWGSDFEKTVTQTFTIEGKAAKQGTYLTLCPVISRAQYFVNDVHGTCIDTTFYFTMSDAKASSETIELQQGLDPGNPATYINRPGINFNSFQTLEFGNSSVSWNGNAESGIAIDITQTKKQTNTIKGKLNLSAELGEMFAIGFEGSFDYSMNTSTSVGTKISAATLLNEAVYSNDVVLLDYDVYWINPMFGWNINNWWLHGGATSQNTWCVTYDVSLIVYKNGDSIVCDQNQTGGSNPNAIIEQISPAKSSLSQNYPNPFKSTTIIKYHIGTDDQQAVSGNQGRKTKLAVYDLSGKEVATLVNESKSTGSYQVELNASQLAPGVYFYSLQSGTFRDVKKLVLLR